MNDKANIRVTKDSAKAYALVAARAVAHGLHRTEEVAWLHRAVDAVEEFRRMPYHHAGPLIKLQSFAIQDTQNVLGLPQFGVPNKRRWGPSTRDSERSKRDAVLEIRSRLLCIWAFGQLGDDASLESFVRKIRDNAELLGVDDKSLKGAWGLLFR